MIKLAVFDLDGTLLNTIQDIANSCNYALNELGYPQRSVEEITTFVGNAIFKLIERAIPENIDKTPEKVDEIYDIYKGYYQKHQTDNTVPFEGIPELLDKLRADGIKLAVFSNKTHSATVEIINEIFPDIMEVTMGRREGYPVKPDPTTLLEIMDSCGVKPNETAYIGDSNVDMQVGNNAGAHTFGVSWGYQTVEMLEDAGAKKVVDNPEELYKEIKSIK